MTFRRSALLQKWALVVPWSWCISSGRDGTKMDIRGFCLQLHNNFLFHHLWSLNSSWVYTIGRIEGVVEKDGLFWAKHYFNPDWFCAWVYKVSRNVCQKWQEQQKWEQTGCDNPSGWSRPSTALWSKSTSVPIKPLKAPGSMPVLGWDKGLACHLVDI